MLQPSETLIRDLGDGLILRHAAPTDGDALADFNAQMHGLDGPPDLPVGIWTRDLLTRPHPTFKPGDFTIVEEVSSHRIVSSVSLISQTWTYEGIPFSVGRPELVATHPEFRRRGLIRQQMDVVHQWSAERGELVQSITGIPNYYRQFGYEMTVALGGARVGFAPYVPKLGDNQTEPYTMRPAEESDIPFMMALEARMAARSAIACTRDAALWHYEIFGRSQGSAQARRWLILQTPEGQPVGAFAHRYDVKYSALEISFYELAEGVSWLAVTPTVIRYIDATGKQYGEGQKESYGIFSFGLGGEHPVYEAQNQRLPKFWEPYGWYIRVPDVPAFLNHIAPALEKRLAASVAVGHTGEVKINLYRRGGVKIILDKGVVRAEAWQPAYSEDGNAGFPEYTFLHVLFGHRTMKELRRIYPDCWADWDASVLLPALFPQRFSNVWGIA